MDTHDMHMRVHAIMIVKSRQKREIAAPITPTVVKARDPNSVLLAVAVLFFLLLILEHQPTV